MVESVITKFTFQLGGVSHLLVGFKGVWASITCLESWELPGLNIVGHCRSPSDMRVRRDNGFLEW
jgi:hypothetical protein